MKINFIKIFFVFNFQLLFIQVFSQKSDTIYFNDKWQICEKSFAAYYRIGTIMQSDSTIFYSGPIKDYYLSGVLQMEGVYSNSGSKDGTFGFYFPNGKLQAHGNFTKNRMYSSWDYYYNNGIKQAKIYYADDENAFTVIDYFDSTGKQLAKDGTGKFEIDVKDENGIGISTYRLYGEFSNGRRDGIWKYFGINSQNDTGRLIQKEIYKNGKLRQGEFYLTSTHVYYSNHMRLLILFFYDKFFATERFFEQKKANTVN